MVRIMIVLLLAGSLFLGWRAMKQQQTIQVYEDALQPGSDVESLAQKILERAHLYTAYKERSAKQGVKGDGADSVNDYIYEIAQRRSVLWGNPRISAPREVTQRDGYEDSIYAITPAERNVAFDRNRIANFLYLIEAEDRRVKVTNIDLRLAERGVDPHEVPPDRWAIDFNVTMREREKR